MRVDPPSPAPAAQRIAAPARDEIGAKAADGGATDITWAYGTRDGS